MPEKHDWRGLIVALLLGAGCPATPPSEAEAARPHAAESEARARAGAPVPVAVAGCDALKSAPACLRAPGQGPERPLVLLVAGPWEARALSLRFEGRPLEPTRVDADVDGLWVELDVDELEGELELEIEGHRPFVLELGRLSEAYADARSALLAQLNAGDLDEARAALARARPQLDATEGHLLDCLVARVNLRHDTDTIPETLARLRAGSQSADELGCVAQFAAQAAHYTTTLTHDFDTSAAAIEQVRAHQDLDLVAQIRADYATGVLATRLGLLDDALDAHTRAGRLAARAGLPRDQGAALVEQAMLLARLGRFGEAARLSSEAERVVTDEFVHEIRFQAAWIDILRRAGDPSVPDPSATLRELVAFYGERGDPAKQSISRLNLAVAALQTGDRARAAEELALVERPRLDERQQLYFELVEFELALAGGDAKAARERLDRADLLAEVTHDREFVLELLAARAKLELHEGRPAQALEAFERSDRLADELAMQIPANRGRSSFSTTLTRERGQHVELLFETGDEEAALCTILAVRARPLRALASGHDRLGDDPERRRAYVDLLARYHREHRGLDERLASAWSLSRRELVALANDEARAREGLDELLEPALALLERDPSPWRCSDVRAEGPGEALLAMVPTSDGDGWWFSFDHAGEVTHVRGLGTAELAANDALAQLQREGRLEQVERLEVVALGEQLGVDFHALAPLAGIELRYALGLGRATTPQPVREGTAIVLASGQRSLSEVEAEAREVEGLLARRGWRVETTWDPHAPQPQLLHYAGHAVHAGAEGWGSYLELASGQHLTSAQLLVEAHAPSFVVLAACDAATSDAAISDGGMNLAVAFLLAGARVVIAADAPVEDETTRAFARALHARLPASAAVDEQALLAALAAIRATEPRFRSWRAWVR